jgi:hemolysin D
MQAGAALRTLSLRRIDAELQDQPFHALPGDPEHLAAQVVAQYRGRRQVLQDATGQEDASLRRVQHELTAARQHLAKLQATVPMYRQSAQSYDKLVQQGFVSELGANDKQRERIEKEQELHAQDAGVAALVAAVEQSRRKLAQIRSEYETQLLNERVGLLAEQQRADGELRKQAWRSSLLELRAQEAGIVKDLATYRPGMVVQPGAVLMKLVPRDEPLFAEVAIHNEDVGFVATGQAVKLKLQAYPFQKYGMLGGMVELVSPDSSAADAQQAASEGRNPQSFRALVRLDEQELQATTGERLKLTPGMAVQAEIHQGRRTVLQYLLSPVQRVTSEAARER